MLVALMIWGLLAFTYNNTKQFMSTTTTIPLNDKKTINGWAMFDWANSAFALVITAAIFPGYFTSVTDDIVNIFGVEMSNSAVYAFATSASYAIITLFSPLLSGIADYGGKRKLFLRFFTTLGSMACLSLFFFEGMNQLAIGIIGYMLAMIGFAGGLVFYNSYLPDIATEDQYDRISACLLYTSPSPRDRTRSRMPSSA